MARYDVTDSQDDENDDDFAEYDRAVAHLEEIAASLRELGYTLDPVASPDNLAAYRATLETPDGPNVRYLMVTLADEEAPEPTPDLDGLIADGDTVDLPDGRKLRLRTYPEEGSDPFRDLDCYGAIAPVQTHPDTGNSRRPDGFTGNAEKIDTRDGRYWWEPPADAPKRGTEDFAQLRQQVRDLFDYGLQIVTLEELRGRDAYGRPIVRRAASLGGVEPFPDPDYFREILQDLYRDLTDTPPEDD